MKEKRMLEMFNIVDETFVEEAMPQNFERKKMKKNINVKSWLAVAASLCIIVGGVALLPPTDSQEEMYYTTDIKDIASMYEGTLLAEKISYEDAYSTSIQLCYSGSGLPYSEEEWNSLSVSASYEDYDLTMDCSFNGESHPTSGENAATVIQYGDTMVYFYKVEATEEYDVSYRAVFEYESLVYELQTFSNDENRIYDVLKTVLGEPNAFSDVLGFAEYYVKAEECSPGFVNWKYYVSINDVENCIAEVFGYSVPGPEIYSKDIDGDGIKELICNCIYGTGAQRVCVYRNNGGVIEVGKLVYDTWDASMFPGIINHGSSYVQERYNPENGTIVITYATEDGEASTVLQSLEWMEFQKYMEE